MIDIERLHRHFEPDPPSSRASGRTFSMLVVAIQAMGLGSNVSVVAHTALYASELAREAWRLAPSLGVGCAITGGTGGGILGSSSGGFVVFSGAAFARDRLAGKPFDMELTDHFAAEADQ